MLKEIQCDEFISYGKKRPTIKFHNGLNTVLGDDLGSNSIGKSTFLMIIDFVFGGNDYIDKSTDIQNNIESHTINFTFEFNNELYHFSRSTSSRNYVNKCNNEYKIIKEWPIKDYRDFLSKQYKLEFSNLTFRDATSRFYRVYMRENLDETTPLHSYKKDKDADAILGLLQIFNKYAPIANQKELKKQEEDKSKAFKKAVEYKYIPAITTLKDFKVNEKQIKELTSKTNDLVNKSSKGLLELSSLQAEQLAILKNRYSNLSRQKTRLNSQLRAISFNNNFSKKSFQKNYADLSDFFPNIDIKKIEDIETFHKNLSAILKSEFTENEKNINSMIDAINEEQQKIEVEMNKINATPNLSKAILEEYSVIDKELKNVIESNNNYTTQKVLDANKKQASDQLKAIILETVATIQNDINTTMHGLNDFIYDGTKTSPVLNIPSDKKYNFYTPNDSGTGSKYRGLILFDLAILKLTNLPSLVHDSVLLKQIEDEAIEKILELYSKSNKQIFIALDKESSYTTKSQEILNKTKVLELSKNGNELFGRSWNEIKE